MSTSRISYDALAVDGLREVLIQVSEACIQHDIDFFIVGAIARNIWYASNNENPSGTKDIDFGIYVADEDKYNLLRRTLIYKNAYVQSTTNAFCLLTSDGKQIDLLPFGAIEKDGQVMIEGKGLTSINLDGFEEAFRFGTKEAIIGEEKYKTCTIPGIVMLKMIAYDDRPEHRIKDVKDINSICNKYSSIEQKYIWAEHFDLYDGKLDNDEVAMLVLGREIRKLVNTNSQLNKRLLGIFHKIIDQHSSFLYLMIEDPENETLEMKQKMMTFIQKGFTEK